MKESTRVLSALGAAVATGLAIEVSGRPMLMQWADGVAPIGTLWVNAIRMTVIPLVVSLLITGVTSAADVREIGRMGRRTIITFVGLLVFLSALVIPVMPSIFHLLPPSGSPPPLPAGAAEAAGQVTGSGQAQSFGAWLVSLIPSNPIAAAANGQMVPLVLFTFLLALAIARGPAPARATLTGFFKSVGDVMLVLVRWVVLAAPIGVFALVLPLAAHAGESVVGAIGFYIITYMATCLLASAALYPLVAMVARVPMSAFARAVLPAQLIAVSSSSSIASLPALVEGAEQRLGLSKKVSGFVLPLAASTFKPASPVSWSVGALFVSWFYGIPLHAPQLGIIAFAAVFLAFAAPGVPRGAFIMLAPLFVAIGLPPEGIGILIAVDVIPDTCSTVLNVTGDLAAAAIVARLEGEHVAT
ncbi:MAG: dicarboxylate/amino acid:cation symporter [Gemmatimonadaceae bacterium]